METANFCLRVPSSYEPASSPHTGSRVPLALRKIRTLRSQRHPFGMPVKNGQSSLSIP